MREKILFRNFKKKEIIKNIQQKNEFSRLWNKFLVH